MLLRKIVLLMCTLLAATITVNADIPNDAVSYNGHSYKFFNTGCKWSEANEACEAMGGHLITITSQGEQDLCGKLIGDLCPKYCWIGASHNSYGWYWVTGEPWDYTSWDIGDGQPNGSGGGDHALIARYFGQEDRYLYCWDDQNDTGNSPSSYWRGYPHYEVTSSYSFICEWEYTQETNHITAAVPPANVKLIKAAAGKGQVTLTWQQAAGADGYVIYRSTHKNGEYKKVKTIKKGTTAKWTNKKLRKGKRYYFKIMAYRIVDGKRVYSEQYSAVKNAKVK